eukprot:4558140-Amphidinium_carterae.1
MQEITVSKHVLERVIRTLAVKDAISKSTCQTAKAYQSSLDTSKPGTSRLWSWPHGACKGQIVLRCSSTMHRAQNLGSMEPLTYVEVWFSCFVSSTHSHPQAAC